MKFGVEARSQSYADVDKERLEWRASAGTDCRLPVRGLCTCTEEEALQSTLPPFQMTLRTRRSNNPQETQHSDLH